MRIIMVEPAGKGGMYTYSDALCRGLCKTGRDVTVVTSTAWPKDVVPYKVKRHLHELMEWKKEWSKLYWAVNRFGLGMLNVLKRNRFILKNAPDVVHIQTGQALLDQFFVRQIAKHLPLVLTVHDVKPHSSSFNASRSFVRRFFHIPHRLIVHHHDGKRQLIEDWGISSEKIDVIPHGIMPVLTQMDRHQARKQLNLPPDRPVALFFGRIRKNKGLDYLLKSLVAVRSHIPDIVLVIAGSPPRGFDFEEYSKIIKRYDLSDCIRTYIHFIPNEDVDIFFAASDIVVLPYLHFESQSGVLLRAYAHKKAVVVSNTGAMGKLVSEDNVGQVVEPGQSEPLAESVIAVLHNLDQYRSHYTRKIEDKYSWNKIAELTADTYKRAIAFNQNK